MQADYDLLGVTRAASTEDVRHAYLKAAKRHHPDKGGDPARFKEVKGAYDRIMRAFTRGANFTNNIDDLMNSFEDMTRPKKRARTKDARMDEFKPLVNVFRKKDLGTFYMSPQDMLKQLHECHERRQKVLARLDALVASMNPG